MTKHTPTPWRINYNKEKDYMDLLAKGNGTSQIMKRVAIITGSHYPDQLDEEGKANAQYIVKCVNSHEDLLEACKKALPILAKQTNEFALIGELVQAVEKAEGR